LDRGKGLPTEVPEKRAAIQQKKGWEKPIGLSQTMFLGVIAVRESAGEEQTGGGEERERYTKNGKKLSTRYH